MIEWKKVEDELPKNCKEVLLWFKNQTSPKSSRLMKGKYISDIELFERTPRGFSTDYFRKKGKYPAFQNFPYSGYDLDGDVGHFTHWSYINEPTKEEDIVSTCCQAPIIENTDFCSKCKEHCGEER